MTLRPGPHRRVGPVTEEGVVVAGRLLPAHVDEVVTVPRPARAALVAGLIGVLEALTLLTTGLVAYGGSVSRFIHAGTRFVTPRPGLAVRAGDGYDGQFVYRLALDPLDLARTAHGITLDSPLRTQRIGLPALAWLLSGGGHAAALPGVLLGIGLASVVAIAALGGLVAAQAGRAAGWGALLAAPSGLEFAVLHDLTEPLEVALLLAALLLVWRARPVAAGVVLAAAALTRETALVLAVALALPGLRVILLRRRLSRPDAAWLVPAAAWLGWQAYVAAAGAGSAAGQGTRDNLGAPFAGIVGLARALPHAAFHQWSLFALQVLLLAWLLVLVAPTVRAAPAPLPLALLLFGVLAVCSSTVVWRGYDDLRFLVEPVALLTVALLRGGRPLRAYALGAGGVWVLGLVLNHP